MLKELNIKQDTSHKFVFKLDKNILELEKENYLMEGQNCKCEAFIQKTIEIF